MTTIIPAQPGTLALIKEADHIKFLTPPIIAWAIDQNSVTPITPLGPLNTNNLFGFTTNHEGIFDINGAPHEITYASPTKAIISPRKSIPMKTE